MRIPNRGPSPNIVDLRGAPQWEEPDFHPKVDFNTRQAAMELLRARYMQQFGRGAGVPRAVEQANDKADFWSGLQSRFSSLRSAATDANQRQKLDPMAVLMDAVRSRAARAPGQASPDRYS